MKLKQREIKVPGYEKVLKITEETTGLEAIVAIHSTRLGPGLGGCRIYPYKNFDSALTDVLRLSKAMTYKSGIVQAGLGGAKSVIITGNKTPELLQAFGAAVEKLKGQYIGAEDVGCTVDDVAEMRKTTRYLTGLVHSKSSGNPSPITAGGVFCGIQATIHELDSSDSLKGKTVAIQGIGSVGTFLIDHLYWAGAHLIIADLDMERAKEFGKRYGAKVVSPDEILFQECDILSPCALGGIINKTTIPKLRCRGIAGATNNQLLEEADGKRLTEAGILYAPDYLINAGGLLNVTSEISPQGYDPKEVQAKVRGIYDQLHAIYDIAKQNRISTEEAANSLVEYRLNYGIGRRIDPPCFHHDESLATV